MAQVPITFYNTVWDYYAQHKRSMPWRDDPQPYKVLVSELMLQQTQVARVIPKFEAFVQQFPDSSALANAPLDAVLRYWSGLGYNRRAKFVWLAAQKIQNDFAGQLPRTAEQLVQLPGVGPNTAGAILAYAYKQPSVFIETNIRTVYLHHFFANESQVSDSQIQELVTATLQHNNPREWYWALMDYGAHLKQITGGRLNQSRHYTKQSAFDGSRRQLRGRILRELTDGFVKKAALQELCDDPRTMDIISDLLQEGLVEQHGQNIGLASGRLSVQAV